MQIPHALQHFPKPTLIILCDRTRGKMWHAFHETLEELETFNLLPELKSDNETSFVNVDSGAVNAPEPSDDDRFHHFVRKLEDHLKKEVDAKHIQIIHLIMEPELLHLVKKELPHNLASLIKKELPHDLMQLPVVEALQRLSNI